MNNRNIPEETKRLVRQDCFFGCVLCGAPIFEYDHIEEFHIVNKHEISNLALLCPNHHREKTSGRLSSDRVKNGRQNPFNKGREHASPWHIEPGRNRIVEFGSNIASGLDGDGDYRVIWINGRNYFVQHSENGWVTFSAAITTIDGEILLLIDRGELKSPVNIWDIKYQGTNLKIRVAPTEIILDMDFSNEKIRINHGFFVDERDKSGLYIKDKKIIAAFKGIERGTCEGGFAMGNQGGVFGLASDQSFMENRPYGFAFFYGP
ncbi:HNH endonuclease signature motif containing protein [Sphingobium sp. CR28]|uniref:HNH endonuclease signature motif containing protein n=1 Tax=Sphingobium sp. CR28 TaxID=3400272 RepID=UPI003FEE6E32